MKKLLLLLLFISCKSQSQVEFKNPDYDKAINEFIQTEIKERNISSVLYRYNDLELAISRLESLADISNDINGKVDKKLFSKEQIANYKKQANVRYNFNPISCKDLNIEFVKDYNDYHNEIKDKLRKKIINNEEAKFLKYRLLTFSQPLFSLNKDTMLVSFSYKNYYGINVYKLVNKKWVFVSTILELMQ